MLARRLTSLLIGILSFHLNFVAVDAACADHVRRDTPRHDAPAMQHHATPSEEASVSDAEPCEIPTQPDCCRAMASCTVNVALDRSSGTDAVSPTREGVLPRSAAVLLSHAIPPDPPPPKA